MTITFADGRTAEMDFAHKLIERGGVFKPLEDVSFFARVHVDPEVGTLIWRNDVDLDPDVLHSEAAGIPLPLYEPT
ncbi:MAG: DUF2442 domain-containing protein [Chloroflexi bacterium]|nr:DUF2442 domain-containing protein [Ardenticatenaceae bacterium]NOG36853.1 DUF2442 domain-containing protein [Chloroflexota bacterium]